MVSGILRATFGRLAITASALSRATIGHIQILGTSLYRGKEDESGKSTVTTPFIKLIPIEETYRLQRLKEDNELIELVTAMAQGGII